MTDPYSTKPPSDECRWICVYPLYMNSRKTVVQGRRIAKDKAVDSPTAQEIFDVLVNAGLKAKIEKQKMHPLDPNRDANSQGRVRVQLRNENGSLFNEKFRSRMAVMLYACEMIPKLKTRQGGVSGSSQGAAAAGASSKARKNKKR